MPKESPDFDCRDPVAVLLLRLRDWCWPTAIAIAVTIPLLGRTNGGAYKIGSITYYANTYGLCIFLPAIFIAGLRWCWIGRIRSAAPNHCPWCDYRLDGVVSEAGLQCCPECGADPSTAGKRRRIPLMRLLLDVPGVLVMLFPIWVFGMLILATFGLLDLD